MSDTYPPVKQRSALLAFAEACDTRPSALRRDQCRDWAIFGNNGHIYAVPVAAKVGYQLMIGCQSAKGWTYAKRRLAFGKLVQDGNEEGSIILDRIPSKAEALEIRYALGIPKRVEYSAEVLAAKRAQFSTVRKETAVLSADSPASRLLGAAKMRWRPSSQQLALIVDCATARISLGSAAALIGIQPRTLRLFYRRLEAGRSVQKQNGNRSDLNEGRNSPKDGEKFPAAPPDEAREAHVAAARKHLGDGFLKSGGSPA